MLAAIPSPLTSADGIEKYLSSGMIRGVGPVYAKKLVRAFGEKVFDVIEVAGIGPVRAARLGCSAGAVSLQRQHMWRAGFGWAMKGALRIGR